LTISNTHDQYGLVAKVFHWLIASLILTLLGVGWWMVDLSYYDPWYHDALVWHKSLGVLVGLMVALKLSWGFFDRQPAPQTTLTSVERITSGLVHNMLRLALVVIPITGYLVSTSEGAAVDVFNGFSVPAVLIISENTRDTAISLHYYAAYSTLALVLLHVAAAFKHQFMDHKGTLKRML